MKLLRLLPLLLLTLNAVGCGVAVRAVQNGTVAIQNSALFHQGRHGQLTEEETRWAQTAWKYFETQTNPATGLVNSVDKYPAASMWHVGDYMAALVAAHQLELIKDQEFDRRLSMLLQTLNTLPLAFNQLPNKLYHTETKLMVNSANQPEETGWSAIDLGRLLIWLKITRERYPQFAEYIDKVVLRWRFCDILDPRGGLYGATKVHDQLQKYQEGRLGYEEYAAMGYQAWGFDTRRSSLLEPYSVIKIYDVEIVHDSRDSLQDGSKYGPVVSLPYILHGMEFNWDRIGDETSLDSEHTDQQMALLAERMYQVQRLRYEREGILTARTDHQLKRAPFFVYDAIFVAGYAWNTITDSGISRPEEALVSTRATFGLWALWKTSYTDRLIEAIGQLFDPGKGWYEGRFEQTGGYEYSLTCTTNAVILEALFYKHQGKLSHLAAAPGHYHTVLQDEFAPAGRCLPSER
ncbi:MAG: DUF3131 domain-containing protein [Deltaproteobacteria bacterium]|nr:DUF3131 domain-containing protein [Deltaproteobacteria bacterium]